jgi:hypothetical protein
MLLLSGSDDMRISYHSDLSIQPPGFCWDCIYGVTSLMGSLDPVFSGLSGVSSQSLFLYLLYGLPTNFSVPMRFFYPSLGCA